MKKFLAITLTLAVLTSAIITGCRSTTKSSSSSEDSTTPVNLTYLWWGSQPRHDATIKVTELYTKEHPNVTFTNMYQSFTGYFDKLSLMAAANNLPDIFQFTVGQATGSEFIDKKLIEPLDSYVTKKEIDLSDMGTSAISTGKIANKLYGLILGTNALGLAVDPAAYQKAGLTVPENGYASWDALGTDLVKLKAVTGAYGGDDVLWLDTVFGFICAQNNENQFDAKNIIGFSQKTYVDYMNLEKKWISQGLIPPLDIATVAAGTPANSQLAKHKAAVGLIYANQFAGLAQAFGGTLQLIPLPGPNAQKATVVLASQHIVMASTSKNKDASARFMSYIINNVDANKILNAERGIPSPLKVLNALKPNFTPEMQINANYMEKIAKTAGPSPAPAPAASSNIYTLLDDLQQQIIFNKVTPEEAYKQVQALAKLDMAQS